MFPFFNYASDLNFSEDLLVQFFYHATKLILLLNTLFLMNSAHGEQKMTLKL